MPASQGDRSIEGSTESTRGKERLGWGKAKKRARVKEGRTEREGEMSGGKSCVRERETERLHRQTNASKFAHEGRHSDARRI